MTSSFKTLCALPFHRMKIDSNGRWQSCCHQTEYYGNIFESNNTIEEDFKNIYLKEVKNSVLKGELHRMCNNTECPLFYQERKKTHNTFLTKYPKQLEIALPSTWCNIGGFKPTPDTACIMCPRSSTEYMKKFGNHPDMTDKILEYIQPAMPTLENLSILGIIEPFFKRKLFDIFDKINFKKYQENIFFWTFCNATLFSDKIQNEYLEYVKRGNIGFSVDAATPKTYKKIRRLDYFKTIERNLTLWFKKVKEKNIEDYSFICNNINLLNVHEMGDMVRFTKKVGASTLQLNPTYISYPDMKLDKKHLCNKNNWEIFWEGQLEAEKVAKELKINLKIYRPFHLGYLKDV